MVVTHDGELLEFIHVFEVIFTRYWVAPHFPNHTAVVFTDQAHFAVNKLIGSAFDCYGTFNATYTFTETGRLILQEAIDGPLERVARVEVVLSDLAP